MQKYEDSSMEATKRAEQDREAVQKLAHADVELKIPSNAEIKETLHEGKRIITEFEKSERGQDLGIAGHVLLQDAKKVLQDGKEVVNTLNQGDKVQNIANQSWSLIKDITFDEELQEMFFNWQSVVASLSSGHDFSDLLRSCGDFLSSIRDTQSFIELLADLVRMLKFLVAEKTERIASFGTQEFKDAGKSEAEQLSHAQEKAIEDLRRLLKQLSENETWKRVVSRSQQISEKVSGVVQHLAEDAKSEAERFADAESGRVDSILGDLETLLQRWVGVDADIQKLISYTKGAVRDILENEKFPRLLSEIQEILSKGAADPSQLDTEETIKRLREYYRDLQEALAELKQNYNVRHAQRESKKLLAAIKSRSQDTKLITDVQKLLFDVRSNRPGELIDPQVLSSLRTMIVPMLIDHLNNFPLPPIEEEVDFLGLYKVKLEDIKISLPGLIPENIHVNIDYALDANVKALEMNNQRVFVRIDARDIQIHMHDVSWSYERESTPKLQDSGKLDLDTGRRGLHLRLTFEAIMGDPSRTVLEVREAFAYAEEWSINFKDSKHNTLYKMLASTFSASIRKEVKRIIEERIFGLGKTLNEKLVLALYDAQKQGWKIAHDAKKASHQLAEKAKETAQDVKGTIAETNFDVTRQIKDELETKAYELAKNLIVSGKIDTAMLSDAAEYLSDKALKVGEKAQELAKEGAEKIAENAEPAADRVAGAVEAAGDSLASGAKKAGDTAARGAKEAGDKIGANARDAGESVARGAEQAGDAISKGAQKAGDATAHGAREAGDAAAHGASKAGDAAAHGAKEAGDKTAHAAHKAGDKAHEAAQGSAPSYAAVASGQAQGTAHEAADKAHSAGQQTSHKAKEAGDEASRKAHEAGHQVADKAQSAGKQTAEKAQDLAGKAADKAREAGDEVSKKAPEAGAKAAEKAEAAGQKTAEYAQNAGQKGGELAREAGAKIAEGARQAGDAIERTDLHELAEDARDKVRAAGDKATSVLQSAEDKLNEKAAEKGAQQSK